MIDPAYDSPFQPHNTAADIEDFESRAELALNLRSSWNHATDPALRPANAYTARAIPQRPGVEVPLEYARIAWQR